MSGTLPSPNDSAAMGLIADAMTAQERVTAIAAFEALGVCKQLAESAASLGWKSPSPIQEQAVPHLLQGVPYASPP